MFGLGTQELVIILLIVLVVFGASRLPALGKGLGTGMRNFKDALRGQDEKGSAMEAKSADREPQQAPEAKKGA